jgi:hypothetical protein
MEHLLLELLFYKILNFKFSLNKLLVFVFSKNQTDLGFRSILRTGLVFKTIPVSSHQKGFLLKG